MANIIRALYVCIALAFFLIALMGAASSNEAKGPEDVPELGGLSEDEVSDDGKEVENHPPKIISLTSNPEKPISGIHKVTNSEGKPVLAVIEAKGSDEDSDYPLEYRFLLSPGPTVAPFTPSDKHFIEESEPGSIGVTVTVRDSRGLESEPKTLNIIIQRASDTTEPDESPGVPGLDRSTSGKEGDEGNMSLKLKECLCDAHEVPGVNCSYVGDNTCLCSDEFGSWKVPPVNAGEGYERCIELYGSPSDKDASDASSKPVSAPSSPGDPGTPTTGAFIMEEEPNDQIGDANEIRFASPATVQGRIAPEGDVDFYKFYAETSGILTVEFETLPAEMKARIGLFGKNLNWIMNKDASNPGDLVALERDVVGPGWNYIAISDVERRAHSDDYTFEATFDPAQDINEPNNAAGDATYAETDQTGTGYICPRDDLDIYTFYADTSGVLKAKLETVPEEMKARIGLFDKNFNWIVNKDASNPGDAITLERGVLGPGSYYVAVSDIDRKAYSEEYSLELIFDPAPDDNEPNNVIGDAAYLDTSEADQTAIGYICPQDDVDFYGFYADYSGIAKVSLNDVPDEMRARIALYGKNFNWIVNVDASNPGDTITLERDIPGPGSYYVAISDIDRKAHSTEYSFDAAFDAAPDDNEPNNQVGDASGAEFGRTITGYVCPRDDLDIYAFYVDASGILEVRLDDVPVEMRPRIALYGKNFNWIVNKDASNAGDAITLEKDVGEAGMYYVAISDIDRKAHSDGYNLMAILKAG